MSLLACWYLRRTCSPFAQEETAQTHLCQSCSFTQKMHDVGRCQGLVPGFRLQQQRRQSTMTALAMMSAGAFLQRMGRELTLWKDCLPCLPGAAALSLAAYSSRAAACRHA